MSYIISIYIFYSFLFFIINTAYINIPFIIQDYTYGNEDAIILKYIYKDILVKFLVGSPSQSVQLSANLGEYSTFIIPKNIEDFDDATYNSDLSHTYKALTSTPETFLFQLYRSALKSQDDFIIEGTNTKINNFVFNLVKEINDNSFYCSYCEVLTQPGMLGLSVAQMKNFEEDVYETNFINQLKNKNLISSYDFYFNFDSSNTGNIIFGSRPDELNQNEKNKELNYVTMKTSALNRDLDWSIHFDQIYYGNIKMNQIKSMLLRIEFGLISGYYEWENVLLNEYFSELIKDNKCFKKNTNALGHYMHYFYCNKNTDLSGFKPFSFTINEFEYNFTLTRDDLFIDIGDKYLFLMVFGGINELVLGLPFCKKYQLIFNPNTKTIGFYINKKENNNNLISIFRKYIIVIIILACVLISLMIIAIVFFKKKKKNKKNATELLDDINNYNKKIEGNEIIDDNNNLN